MLRTSRYRVGMTILFAGLLPALLLVGSPATASGTFIEHQAWQRSGPLGPSEPREQTLYASTVAGQEQTRSFVDLDVAGMEDGGLDSAVLVLTETEGSLLSDRARLKACGLVTPLAEDGEITGRPPEVDCELTEAVTRVGDGTWEVALQPFAALLQAGTIAGVAVLPAPDETTAAAFTVAFDSTQTRVDGSLGGEPTTTSLDETPADDSSDAPMATEGFTAGVDPFPAMNGPTESTAPQPSLAGLSEQPTAQPVPQPVTADAQANGTAAPIRTAAAAAESHTGRSLLFVALVVLAGGLLLLARQGIVVPPVPLPGGRATPTASVSLPAGAGARLLPWLIVPALVMLLSETTAYKIGIIAIVFVGAIGLHILVNVAGELSLAHAAFVGIPAFAVAQFSSRADVSPILGIPIGVVAGVAIGLAVAVTALRARGLQVALVTLAVAIATVQFLFFRQWFIGPPEGLAVPVPSVFGIDLDTNIARVPVLTAVVALAVLAGTAIITSKLGRGLSLMRTDPDVAAAAGIPVSLYRGMAYAIAGGFAGLAGSCYVFWVQLVTPQAFPLQLGFTYLLIAALAGRGGLGGVAVSALIVQGGAMFTFLPRSITLFVAPVALILQVTRFEGGINASLRGLREVLANKKWSMPMTTSNAHGPHQETTGIRLPAALGMLLVAAGFASIAVAWYNTGRTTQLWIQNQEIVSGGLIGLGLIIFGSVLLLRDALLHGSATVRERVLVEPQVLLDADLLPRQPVRAHDETDTAVAPALDDDPDPRPRARPGANGHRRAPVGGKRR